MVSNVRIHRDIPKGDEYRIEARLVDRQDNYTLVTGHIHMNGKVYLDVHRISYGLIHADGKDIPTYQSLFKELLSNIDERAYAMGNTDR
jgi:hypothetical protein